MTSRTSLNLSPGDSSNNSTKLSNSLIDNTSNASSNTSKLNSRRSTHTLVFDPSPAFSSSAFSLSNSHSPSSSLAGLKNSTESHGTRFCVTVTASSNSTASGDRTTENVTVKSSSVLYPPARITPLLPAETNTVPPCFCTTTWSPILNLCSFFTSFIGTSNK